MIAGHVANIEEIRAQMRVINAEKTSIREELSNVITEKERFED